MAAVEPRTGAELIRAVADQVRAGRHIDDAILRALHGEHRDRYTNLVADLAGALHLDEQINRWDVDRLANENAADPAFRQDHPATYATRLVIWAETMHSPSAVAAALDSLADEMGRAMDAALVDEVASWP